MTSCEFIEVHAALAHYAVQSLFYSVHCRTQSDNYGGLVHHQKTTDESKQNSIFTLTIAMFGITIRSSSSIISTVLGRRRGDDVRVGTVHVFIESDAQTENKSENPNTSLFVLDGLLLFFCCSLGGGARFM